MDPRRLSIDGGRLPSVLEETKAGATLSPLDDPIVLIGLGMSLVMASIAWFIRGKLASLVVLVLSLSLLGGYVKFSQL